MTSPERLRLFSIAYKPVEYGFPGGWIEPFAVGPLAAQCEPGVLNDAHGDTIAQRNASLGELTAHYWVWKNLAPTEFVGFCHYRRYFNLMAHPQIALPKVFAAPSPEVMSIASHPQQREIALQVLDVCDVITTRSYTLGQTISQQFIENHGGDIWAVFCKLCAKNLPSG